jgi:ribonuclease HI
LLFSFLYVIINNVKNQREKRIIMDTVTIYTDGACSGNPGKGGWGAILIYNEVEKVISGGEKETTNNRMELTAPIEALKLLKKPCKVKLYSDSAYLINTFTQGWMYKWQMNGWRTADKGDVKNKDLWEQIYKFTKIHDIEWIKVKGHSDNEYNNRCDELAVAAISKML